MKILAIDTTTEDMTVVLICDNDIIDGSVNACGRHHSEMLCGAVADLMRKADVGFDDLDAYACAVGPGSFTGIRIGVSTVKGYATACDKPLIGVNCLQAIGNSKQLGGKNCAFIDSGNGYYFADFAHGVAPCLVPYDFAETHPDVPLCGKSSQYLDGFVDVVRQKYASGNFDSELTPLYIRKSQAEENK